MLELARHTISSVPTNSSIEVIAFPDLESDEVRSIAASWLRWAGSLPMPPREALSERDLGRYAANVSLVRVVGKGEDYAFRVVGDVHVQTYGASYQGRTVRDVIADAPRFGHQLKASYESVRASGRPFALRGFIGLDIPDARFSWFETAYFPFGTGDVVDHILNAAVYQLRSRAFPSQSISRH